MNQASASVDDLASKLAVICERIVNRYRLRLIALELRGHFGKIVGRLSGPWLYDATIVTTIPLISHLAATLTATVVL